MPAIKFNSPKSLNNSYGGNEMINQRRVTIQMLNPQPGEAALDVGCGTGFLTAELAQKVRHTGSVSAVDLSEDMVQETNERCKQWSQVDAKIGDVTALEYADGNFDLASCTQVLLYVSDVEKAIREMVRVLCSGGRLAILETDWRGAVHHSNHPDITRRIYASWDDAVPSPNLPAYLKRHMLDSGLVDIRVAAIPLLDTEWNPASFSINSLDWLSNNAYKRGAISKQESADWRQDMATLGEQDDYFFCVNRFLFIGNKPG